MAAFLPKCMFGSREGWKDDTLNQRSVAVQWTLKLSKIPDGNYLIATIKAKNGATVSDGWILFRRANSSDPDYGTTTAVDLKEHDFPMTCELANDGKTVLMWRLSWEVALEAASKGDKIDLTEHVVAHNATSRDQPSAGSSRKPNEASGPSPPDAIQATTERKEAKSEASTSTSTSTSPASAAVKTSTPSSAEASLAELESKLRAELVAQTRADLIIQELKSLHDKIDATSGALEAMEREFGNRYSGLHTRQVKLAQDLERVDKGHKDSFACLAAQQAAQERERRHANEIFEKQASSIREMEANLKKLLEDRPQVQEANLDKRKTEWGVNIDELSELPSAIGKLNEDFARLSERLDQNRQAVRDLQEEATKKRAWSTSSLEDLRADVKRLRSDLRSDLERERVELRELDEAVKCLEGRMTDVETHGKDFQAQLDEVKGLIDTNNNDENDEDDEDDEDGEEASESTNLAPGALTPTISAVSQEAAPTPAPTQAPIQAPTSAPVAAAPVAPAAPAAAATPPPPSPRRTSAAPPPARPAQPSSGSSASAPPGASGATGSSSARVGAGAGAGSSAPAATEVNLSAASEARGTMPYPTGPARALSPFVQAGRSSRSS